MVKIARFVILPIAFVLAVSCSGSKPAPEAKPEPQGGMVSAMAKMGKVITDPIAQMSLEFEGNPPQDQIREELDKTLVMYMLEPNNQNRANAGRVLVTLRKETGHSEMAILEKMLNSPAEGKFEDAAAKTAAAMSQ